MTVTLSDEAERDLEEIGDWIARDSPRRALSFVRELRKSCESLSTNPQRFQVVTRYRDAQIRRRVHGNFLIFYRLTEGDVTVLRIVHGARDIEPLIVPED